MRFFLQTRNGSSPLYEVLQPAAADLLHSFARPRQEGEQGPRTCAVCSPNRGVNFKLVKMGINFNFLCGDKFKFYCLLIVECSVVFPEKTMRRRRKAGTMVIVSSCSRLQPGQAGSLVQPYIRGSHYAGTAYHYFHYRGVQSENWPRNPPFPLSTLRKNLEPIGKNISWTHCVSFGFWCSWLDSQLVLCENCLLSRHVYLTLLT